MKRQVKLKLRRNDTVLKNAEHVLKSYQQPPNIFREPMNITVTVVGSRGNICGHSLMFSNIYVQRSTIDKIIQSVLGPNLCWIIRTQGSRFKIWPLFLSSLLASRVGWKYLDAFPNIFLTLITLAPVCANMIQTLAHTCRGLHGVFHLYRN